MNTHTLRFVDIEGKKSHHLAEIRKRTQTVLYSNSAIWNRLVTKDHIYMASSLNFRTI
jgi:hypothetical protein